jgi:hypothetical protein
VAKKKTGFSRPPEKDVDSSKSLAFINAAGGESSTCFEKGVEQNKQRFGASRPEEIMDEEFAKAVEHMITVIKKADEQGWTSTSKSTALSYVEMFRHMIMIDGSE